MASKAVFVKMKKKPKFSTRKNEPLRNHRPRAQCVSQVPRVSSHVARTGIARHGAWHA